jgi:NAD(P)-dependent dehydrogenase (short-subunit alcohol dehydrogenase family)
MDYTDRRVIVTGGTGALGSAVVGALIEAGADVLCLGGIKTRCSDFRTESTRR